MLRKRVAYSRLDAQHLGTATIIVFYISRRRSPVFFGCTARNSRESRLSLCSGVSRRFLSISQWRGVVSSLHTGTRARFLRLLLFTKYGADGMLLSLHHPLALTLTVLTKLGMLILMLVGLMLVLLGSVRGGRVQGVLVFHYVTISRHLFCFLRLVEIVTLHR